MQYPSFSARSVQLTTRQVDVLLASIDARPEVAWSGGTVGVVGADITGGLETEEASTAGGVRATTGCVDEVRDWYRGAAVMVSNVMSRCGAESALSVDGTVWDEAVAVVWVWVCECECRESDMESMPLGERSSGS